MDYALWMEWNHPKSRWIIQRNVWISFSYCKWNEMKWMYMRKLSVWKDKVSRTQYINLNTKNVSSSEMETEILSWKSCFFSVVVTDNDSWISRAKDEWYRQGQSEIIICIKTNYICNMVSTWFVIGVICSNCISYLKTIIHLSCSNRGLFIYLFYRLHFHSPSFFYPEPNREVCRQYFPCGMNVTRHRSSQIILLECLMYQCTSWSC